MKEMMQITNAKKMLIWFGTIMVDLLTDMAIMHAPINLIRYFSNKEYWL
jgi:hypothetical protein